MARHTRRGSRPLDRSRPRGEYVLVVEGAPAPAPATDDALLDALRAQLATGADRRSAIAVVIATSGAAKNRVYDLALTIPKTTEAKSMEGGTR